MFGPFCNDFVHNFHECPKPHNTVTFLSLVMLTKYFYTQLNWGYQVTRLNMEIGTISTQVITVTAQFNGNMYIWLVS